MEHTSQKVVFNSYGMNPPNNASPYSTVIWYTETHENAVTETINDLPKTNTCKTNPAPSFEGLTFV